MKKYYSTMAIAILLTLFSQQVLAQESTQPERSFVDVEAFTGVEVGNFFKVILSQGESSRVEIKAAAKDKENISFDVSNNVLIIKNKGIKEPDNFALYITLKELSFLKASGASFIKGSTAFKGDKLHIEGSGASEIELELRYSAITTEASGATNMTLKGWANELNANVSGAANFKAPYLEANTINVDASGASKAILFNAENFSSEVSGMATVVKGEEGLAGSEQEDYTTSGQDVKVVEDGNKTKVKIGNMDIEIIEGEETEVYVGNSKIKIDKDGNIDLGKKKRKKKKRSNFNGHFRGIDVGYNGMLFEKTDDLRYKRFHTGLALIPHKSLQVNLNLFEKSYNLIDNRFGVVTGVGLTWNNYVFADESVSFDESGEYYTTSETDPHALDVEYKKSEIEVFSGTIPLMLEFQTNKYNKKNSFHISAGAQFIYEFRVKSELDFIYKGNHSTSEREVNLRDNNDPYRFELVARVGWGRLNLFGTYSLNRLFANVVPFTVGITVWNW